MGISHPLFPLPAACLQRLRSFRRQPPHIRIIIHGCANNKPDVSSKKPRLFQNETSAVKQRNQNKNAKQEINMNTELEEKIQTKAEKIRREYKVEIDPAKPIKLNVDGLCENPGAMHIGLIARQEDRILFAEHLYVGNGTCNEAEYIAVKSGLALLQILCPTPTIPVAVFSDSQLVTKQVAGLWKSSGQMQSYCFHLRKLSRVYPFTLTKVPRRENQMADSLAQKCILKTSGRCLTLEQGRFNVLKAKRETFKLADPFNAITSREFRDYLKEHNLHKDLLELIRLANDGDREEAIHLARDIQGRVTGIFEAAPKANEMVAQWVNSASEIVNKTISLIIQAIEKGDKIDFQYFVEEISGADIGDATLFTNGMEAVQKGLVVSEHDGTDMENGTDFD